MQKVVLVGFVKELLPVGIRKLGAVCPVGGQGSQGGKREGRIMQFGPEKGMVRIYSIYTFTDILQFRP